jgi:NSS family neurotransmitter:Na+ symporter
MPCVLSFCSFGTSWGVLNTEDFLVSNILLPLGCLTLVIFCTQKFGWGFDKYKQEANIGKGLKVQNWMRFYMTYILPLLILALFVIGVITFDYSGNIFSLF